MNDYILDPHAIETESFRRIEEIAGDHGFPPDRWPIVRRMIHTTADFEYLESTRFHPGAVEAGIAALRAGKSIVTDTRMLLAGISTGRLKKLGVNCTCLVDDPEVAEDAKARGVTRSIAAMDKAKPILEGGIAAIGNAPTALLRLLELIKSDEAHPALIVGIPVGFVSAAESKDLLLEADVPFITAVGRKGGSPVTASVINAMAVMALES